MPENPPTVPSAIPALQSGRFPDGGTPGGKPARLLSLDAFRGFDIAAMLFVNMTWNREVFHPQFFHVEWNDPRQGATFTDLVFPWFLFIMGCAVPLSVRSGRGKGRRWWTVLAVGLKRAVVLYLLGVLLTVASGAYDNPLKWTQLLSWNILQLIGVGYFVALAVFLLPRWAQIVFVVVVLAGKWALMTLMPWEFVDGLVASRAPEGAPLGPGTWAHFDAIKRVVNLEHLDPGWTRWLGGWLGMAQQFLPCAAIAVLGGWFAEMLTAKDRAIAWKLRSVGLFGAGLLGVAYLLQAGYAPEGDGWLGRFTVPFSKWFFSPAYCLLAAGTEGLLLGAFFWVIDVSGWTKMTFLRIYGMNAIVLYVGAEFTFKTIFSKWQMVHPNGYSGNLAGGYIAWWTEWSGSPAVGGWAFVLTWLAMWWVVCWRLYAKKIFVRV